MGSIKYMYYLLQKSFLKLFKGLDFNPLNIEYAIDSKQVSRCKILLLQINNEKKIDVRGKFLKVNF